mgnify:CR=1 FL=1
MSSEWTECSLGDVLTLQRGMDLPKGDRTVAGKYPVVASNGIVGYHDQFQAKGPGVVIGRSGSIGGGQYIKGDYWPLNTTLWVRDFKGNIPRYCYYLLKSIDFSKFNVGTGVPTLNRNHIHPMAVLRPSKTIQEKIVHLLGGIDDFIASLQKENVALESIAQTLFRSWFVNFDPVHAKTAGNDPEAMSAELTSLFPSEFENSDLGLIPKGWMSTSLGDVTNFIKGRSYKSDELQPSSVALVTLKSFQRGGGFRLDGFKPYVGRFHENQVVNPGECIVALTDVTQNAEVIGRPAMVYPSEFKTIASLDVGILRPKTKTVTKEFLYCLLREQRYIAHILGFTTGTTVLHLAKDGVPSYKFALPSADLMERFGEVAGPLFKTIEVNILLANRLACLRDHLLPRLISGKLRIEDAEASVVEITSGMDTEPV